MNDDELLSNLIASPQAHLEQLPVIVGNGSTSLRINAHVSGLTMIGDPSGMKITTPEQMSMSVKFPKVTAEQATKVFNSLIQLSNSQDIANMTVSFDPLTED